MTPGPGVPRWRAEWDRCANARLSAAHCNHTNPPTGGIYIFSLWAIRCDHPLFGLRAGLCRDLRNPTRMKDHLASLGKVSEQRRATAPDQEEDAESRGAKITAKAAIQAAMITSAAAVLAATLSASAVLASNLIKRDKESLPAPSRSAPAPAVPIPPGPSTPPPSSAAPSREPSRAKGATSRTRPTPSPPPKRNCRKKYIVHTKGKILDGNEREIGVIEGGDTFLRDSSAQPPSSDLSDRWFGTINHNTSDSMSGWVLIRKLNYERTICK
jgi:hypothetical protein